MSINITINLSGFADVYKGLDALDKETVSDAMAYTGTSMNSWLKSWYTEKGRGHWINPGLPTHGAGRRDTGWTKEHAIDPWALEDTGADHFTLANDSSHFALKVEGGTIRAKNARFLTIPLIPEAHALRARVFESQYGVNLFPKGGALMGMVDEKLTAVYALKISVTLDPWPEALPADVLLSKAYEGYFSEALGEFL